MNKIDIEKYYKLLHEQLSKDPNTIKKYLIKNVTKVSSDKEQAKKQLNESLQVDWFNFNG